MAGFMFFINGEDAALALETTIKQGVFAPYISNVKSMMVDTLSDFYSMRPGDNIYFVSNRKVYGVGKLKLVGEDCKYNNYISANELNMAQRLGPDDKPVVYNEPHYRWLCCFEPGNIFYKSGIDIDEVIECRPYIFKNVGVSGKRVVIRFEEEANQGLKDYINLKNKEILEGYPYSEAFHEALKGIVGPEYLIDEQNVSQSELRSEVEIEGYDESVIELYDQVSEVSKPLLKRASNVFDKIEKALYSAPQFINIVKASVPVEYLQAVLTDEQKEQIAAGALKLMTKKDGSLLATLVVPGSNKIVSHIPLKSVKLAPEMNQALTSFSTQMQLVQIAEEIKTVQTAVEEVRRGQEYDRLATAYSCQQKLIQAMSIKKPELKEMALIQLASAAEDSRNLLMLTQKDNVELVKNEPEDFFKKLLSSKTELINQRISEIRESLCAVNMASLVEALAYQELGEQEAARNSFTYYADFIEKTYLSVPGLIERLDLIDPSPENYWTKNIPVIIERIRALPCNTVDEGIEVKKVEGD